MPYGLHGWPCPCRGAPRRRVEVLVEADEPTDLLITLAWEAASKLTLGGLSAELAKLQVNRLPVDKPPALGRRGAGPAPPSSAVS